MIKTKKIWVMSGILFLSIIPLAFIAAIGKMWGNGLLEATAIIGYCIGSFMIATNICIIFYRYMTDYKEVKA